MKDIIKFPYKLFVFGEKVRTKAISARQTTCISPTQLIMTASNVKIENGKLYVDDWIPFEEYDLKDAANLCLIRAEMDALLITAVTNPDGIRELSEEDDLLVKTITSISSVRATPIENEIADCHASIRNDTRDRSDMFGAPPPKFSRGGGGGAGFAPSRGGFNNDRGGFSDRGGFHNRGGFNGNRGGFRGKLTTDGLELCCSGFPKIFFF